MRFSALFIFFFTFTISLSGIAQPRLDRHYVYKQYTTYDGLVQSQVNRIVQDSKGYLWICTKGGLSRFDGAKFQNFVDTKDGERINIQNIIEVSDGFIVNSLTKFFKFTYQEENPEIWNFEDIVSWGNYRFYVNVQSFFNAADNSLYILNARQDGWSLKKVIHLKYDFTKKVFQPLSFSSDPIILSFLDKDTRCCLSLDRVFFLRDSTFESRPLPGRFDNYALNPIDSTFYAAQQSSKTIFRIGKDFLTCVPVYKNISIYLYSWSEPNTFIVNRSGQPLFFDMNRQVNIPSHFASKIVATLNFPRHMFLGREGNLWVSTEEGIVNLFQLDFEQYKFNITKAIDNIWSIICAPDSTMWFGGYYTGVWSVNTRDQIKVYNYRDFNVPPSDTLKFKAMYMGGIRDQKGTVFIPSSDGLLIIDKNNFKYRNTKDVPMSLYDDPKNNRLILGKIAGLEIIEKGTWKTILNVPFNYNLISTCINRDGKVMAGSFRKQFILEGDSLKPYPSKKNLGVISMVKDERGNIWKGTPIGLYLDDGKTETEILPGTIQGSVLSVFVKHPWLMATTVKNMYLINLDQFYRDGNASADKFGADNGYIAMDGGQNGFCEDNEGKIWYTVSDKVLRFSPDSLARHYSDYLPKPHFASFSYSNNGIDWQRKAPEDSIPIVCDHQYNSIRFSMFAVSETRADMVTYQYRLKGMSNEWSLPTRETQQSFTNLNPGKYTIEIRSSVDGNKWSETVASPIITIQAALWQRWWAYLVEILLFGGMITFGVVYYMKKRQKMVIQRLTEQKRLNELRLQSVRSKNIPHFSGNVLANIEHFIFASDLRQANKFLTKYSKLMNITLLDADKSSRAIEKELEYVCLYLELEKMRFGDQLEFVIQVAPTVNQQIEIPNMLLQTWVENSIKHGIRHKSEVGKIKIEILGNVNSPTEISVEDNGIGRIKAQELGTTGSGQGLRILEEQINIYNLVNKSKIAMRVIDMKNEDGTIAGTRFEMIIPQDYKFELK